LKRFFLLITIAVVVSCKKTTNNTTSNFPLPPFIINGITDVTFTNGSNYSVSLPITVQYEDSTQETVSLSLTGLPTGVTMDTTIIRTGIPTFSTVITLSDTLSAGLNPGSYSVNLVAEGSKSGTKTYPFNIIAVSPASCTSNSNVLGNYSYCFSSSLSSTYVDSITADPLITNKVWFGNVYGKGVRLFGYYDCNTKNITIPTQVAAGVTYLGSGNLSGSHYIGLSISSSSSGNISITME
jgi:hypothetical protein